MLVLAAILSVAMGVVLGLLGGGGSILTVPILVYAVGIEPKTAIATSLFVVGTTSAAGMAEHALAGRVHWRRGLLFGAAAMGGAYGAGRLAAFVPATVLLLLFAGLMTATAVGLLRNGGAGEKRGRRKPRFRPVRIVAQGLVIGAVTGLVGAGGGFLIVPALVLIGGLPMREAIGTSLLVITLNSMAGFAGHAAHVELDWGLTALVTGAAIVGSIAGARLAGKLPQRLLRRGFAWFVLAMAAFIVVRELPDLFDSGAEATTPHVESAGAEATTPHAESVGSPPAPTR